MDPHSTKRATPLAEKECLVTPAPAEDVGLSSFSSKICLSKQQESLAITQFSELLGPAYDPL